MRCRPPQCRALSACQTSARHRTFSRIVGVAGNVIDARGPVRLYEEGSRCHVLRSDGRRSRPNLSAPRPTRLRVFAVARDARWYARLPGRPSADRGFFRDRRRFEHHEIGTGNSHAGPNCTPRSGPASGGRSRTAVPNVATRPRLLDSRVELFRRRASCVGACCLVVHFPLTPGALCGVTHPVPSLGIRRARLC